MYENMKNMHLFQAHFHIELLLCQICLSGLKKTKKSLTFFLLLLFITLNIPASNLGLIWTAS